MADPVDQKAKLRAAMRTRRRAHVAELPDGLRALMLNRPPGPVAALLPPGSVVGLYHAIGAEAPTLGWARWLWENGRTLALPWFAGRDAAMAFRRWDDPRDENLLVPGPWGALQPHAGSEAVSPAAVIVPLIAFTADGRRLGQGGGHYDRWLAAHPQARAIGLGWDCQHVDSLPTEAHDRPLDAVVTPTRIHSTTPLPASEPA